MPNNEAGDLGRNDRAEQMHGSYWLPYKAVLDELGSTVKRFGVRRTQGCPAQSSRYISFVEILLQKGNVNGKNSTGYDISALHVIK